MDNTFTYYELLGVRPDASLSAIQDAYRAAMRQYHPDVNKAPNAQQIAAMMNRAYEVLGDPRKRAAYDREIGVRSDSTGAARSQGRGSEASPGQDRGQSTATAPADTLSSAIGWLVTRVVGGVVVIVVGLALAGLLLHVLPFILVAGLIFLVVRGLLRSIF
jgi:curved DNA-binding protein CbpA